MTIPGHLTATQTETREIVATTLLPEEIQDILAEQALEELNEAKKVKFTPVEDAAKLDQLIAHTQSKLNMLLELDVADLLKSDLQSFANLERGDGSTEKIALINQMQVTLHDRIKIEDKIASSVKRYQSILVEAMKAKRLLSGQMFGTRLSHSAQVSRMKRVRQITLTGTDMMKEFTNTAITPKQEMEVIEKPKQNVIELFPATEPQTFDPLPDLQPFEQAIEPEQKAEKEVVDSYCSSYED